MNKLILLIILFSASFQSFAQADSAKNKQHTTLTIGSGGIVISKTKDSTVVVKSDDDVRSFDIHFGMLDLGINSFDDKTDYSSAAAQSFLSKIDPAQRNSNLFAQNNAKSINVNIVPFLARFSLFHSTKQRVYLSAGVGLQLYNFRFNKNISYLNITNPEVIMDSVDFSKNKLAFTYLNIPLMITSKTKLAKKTWLVYGAGITGGYRLSSWTKQISDERGKQKNHDQFNFRDFNTCVTGEVGIDGVFRLYASYQLTSIATGSLDQHPFCIGVRFLGI